MWLGLPKMHVQSEERPRKDQGEWQQPGVWEEEGPVVRPLLLPSSFPSLIHGPHCEELLKCVTSFWVLTALGQICFIMLSSIGTILIKLLKH